MINEKFRNKREFKIYKEHSGILVRKTKNVFGKYIFTINDGTKTVSVKVGKELFEIYQLNAQLTIGFIGKKLINIRSGFN